MVAWILSFPTDVELRRTASDALRLERHEQVWTLPQLSKTLEASLRVGSTWEELEQQAQAHELYHLYQLDQAGLLCRTLMGDRGPLASWVPNGPQQFVPLAPSVPGRLSRFAYIRRQGNRHLLETPLRAARLELYDWRATAAVWAYPQVTDLLSPLESEALFCLLDNCGAVARDPEPALWEFHDLLFHAHSRSGRSPGPHGKWARPLPAQLDEVDEVEDWIALEAVSPDHKDPGLIEVMEARRSQREHGEQPIGLRQLGEFLWRCAREQSGRRPYPGAGQAYELEVCLAVGRCQDLAAGLYRYRADQHRLQPVFSDLGPALLAEAGRPQVLLIMSARFAKMTSRYRSIAYSNILKDVGVVMQTMYLVATAMGLAACAQGTGNSDLFCRAFGTEYTLESSVGEFSLGSQALPEP